jgi:hypothetical protein
MKKKLQRKTAKSRKTKSPKKSEPKAARRRRFVAGLIDGKSMRKAAVDAGYTQSMADKAGEKILPGAREEFQAVLARKVPNEVLVRRIAEGLNAKETKLSQIDGEFTDERHLVAWSERRRMVELASKLLGYMVEQVEIGQSEEAPLNFNLNVRFPENDKPRAKK